MTQCGLDLYIKDGKIVKVEGSKEHAYNQGSLCPKGAATRQYVYHEDRIKTPLKRIGSRGSNQFIPISWEEALETIACKLNVLKKEYGPESVAFFSGFTKYFRPYLKRLTHSFGSPNYITESSCCYHATAMTQALVFGRQGLPDMANTDCLLLWSGNPFYTNPGNGRNLVKNQERGMKLIVVDPRITPTTARADIHLRLRPGTDGALALAMAHVIINEKLYDQDFVANHTYGFEEYRDYVQHFTPEEGHRLTGVPADLIKEAARMYAKAKTAAISQCIGSGSPYQWDSELQGCFLFGRINRKL